MPSVLGSGILLGVALAGAQYTGGAVFSQRPDPYEDKFATKEEVRRRFRRPVNELINEIGEGRGKYFLFGLSARLFWGGKEAACPFLPIRALSELFSATSSCISGACTNKHPSRYLWTWIRRAEKTEDKRGLWHRRPRANLQNMIKHSLEAIRPCCTYRPTQNADRLDQYRSR
jgi:hypothetical protein